MARHAYAPAPVLTAEHLREARRRATRIARLRALLDGRPDQGDHLALTPVPDPTIVTTSAFLTGKTADDLRHLAALLDDEAHHGPPTRHDEYMRASKLLAVRATRTA